MAIKATTVVHADLRKGAAGVTRRFSIKHEDEWFVVDETPTSYTLFRINMNLLTDADREKLERALAPDVVAERYLKSISKRAKKIEQDEVSPDSDS